MNKGISLTELAAILEKVEREKRDYLVPSPKMEMVGGRDLEINGVGMFNVNPLAHEQIGSKLGIPRDYYKRMQSEAPDLLDANVNRWLRSSDDTRFVRTQANNVRAILSDKYKPRENYGLASTIIPIFLKAGDIQVVSSNVTDQNMYIKVISHELQGEVKVGQIVKGGVLVRNSEVGCGAFELSMFVLTLACMNGMIRENSMREVHVGKRLKNGDENNMIYSQATIEADNKAFLMMVEDTMKYAFNRQKFDEELVKYRRAAENPLNTRQITETIEDVTKRYSLTQTEGKDVLSRLLQGGDMSQWGLAGAVTNLAADVSDYERSTELERIGGKIIDLQPAQWRTVARLAA